MYLQNTSDTVVVMINTVVGRFGLKPHEVIHLEQRLLPPISEHIKKITEQEYNTFRGEPEKTEEPPQELERTSQTVDNESHKESVEDQQPEEIVEDITKNLQDTNASNFIKQLLNFSEPPQEVETPKPIIDFEAKGQEATTDALITQNTDSTNELSDMEKQLEELKKAWMATRTPKKKDKISKQIKEVQKQIDKLNKDINKVDADE